jgi:hypothetical protein
MTPFFLPPENLAHRQRCLRGIVSLFETAGYRR